MTWIPSYQSLAEGTVKREEDSRCSERETAEMVGVARSVLRHVFGQRRSPERLV